MGMCVGKGKSTAVDANSYARYSTIKHEIACFEYINPHGMYYIPLSL